MSGSGSGYYRSSATIPASEGLHSANTIHLWCQSTAVPSTADLKAFVELVGGPSPAQNPHDQVYWNHTSGSFYKTRAHRNAAGSYVSAQLASTPAANTWHSWASTFDGTNARSYLAGTLDGTSSGSGAAEASQVYVDALALIDYSGSYTAGSQFSDAQIAELAIWNVALDTAEIAALAKGFRASMIRPSALKFYAPVVRGLMDVRGGRTFTSIAGTDVSSDHPRVIG